MNANHQQQIDQGRLDSLTRAGIGQRYHHGSLLHGGKNGEEIATWIKANAKAHLTAGRSFYLYGTTGDEYDLTMLMARSFHLGGFGVKVASVIKLIGWIKRQDEAALADVAAAKLLVVPRFYVPEAEGDRPFSYYEAEQIEDMMLDRVAGGRAMLLQGTARLLPQSSRWWRADAMNQILSTAQVFEVKQ